MALHRRSPRPLALALRPVSAAASPGGLLAQSQAAWTTAVGAVIAKEARPVSERAGTLTVACTAAVWAQEIELMATPIVERLNAQLTDGKVTGLRCVSDGR